MLQRDTDCDVQDDCEESQINNEKENLISNLVEYIKDIYIGFLFLFGGTVLLPSSVIFDSAIMGFIGATCIIVALISFATISPQDYEEHNIGGLPDKNEIDYLLNDDYPDDPDLLPHRSNRLIEGEELVNLRDEFPRVQNYYLCEIGKIFVSNSNKNEIKITASVPSGTKTFVFDFPYNWSESEFGDFAQSHGYNENNFHNIKGDYIFVKYEDDNTVTLVLNDPKQLTRQKIEDDEWKSNDGNFEALEDKLGLEFNNVATGEEIIVDDLQFDLDESVL